MARTGQFRVLITKPNDGETLRKVLAAIASHTPTKARALEVIVRPEVKVKSRDQLGYYWHIVRAMAAHSGNDPDDLDEILTKKFVGTRDVVTAGEVHKFPRSKADLSMQEMSKVIEQVKHWGGLHLDFQFEEDGQA